jgi:mannose-1-phosphate guanylyltransferase/mannose-6-phosphate isomerase
MIVVIIAGGSGTRLWPLSTHDYPKHLLKLTNERSLLQNTYDRVSHLTDDDNIFVVPEVSHVEHVYEQVSTIPKKNILHEPARRGTASCFVLALSEIKKRNLKDQAIFFLWADHLIRDIRGFKSSVTLAGKLAETEKKLVFMGVEPTYPSTGLGYMHKGEQLQNGFKSGFVLEGFVEKPDKEKAQEYYESGEYLWNTGYLMGTLSTFERELEEVAPRLWKDYQAMLVAKDADKTYLDFESEAIDYALSEHVKDGLVVPGNFDWADIGSFTDLHSHSRQGNDGNHIKGENIELENVTNSYVRNEQDLPIAVIGLDNVAVVATKNGVLITNKTHAQKVGDIAKRLQQK